MVLVPLILGWGDLKGTGGPPSHASPQLPADKPSWISLTRVTPQAQQRSQKGGTQVPDCVEPATRPALDSLSRDGTTRQAEHSIWFKPCCFVSPCLNLCPNRYSRPGIPDNIFGCPIWGGGAPGTEWVEARDSQHPIMCRTASCSTSRDVSGATAEELCFTLSAVQWSIPKTGPQRYHALHGDPVRG